MRKTAKSREFDRFARLNRRADFLRERLAKKYGNSGSLNYDAGELSALKWAIPVLEAYLVKKHTAKLDISTLQAIKHEIPEHLYNQLLESRLKAEEENVPSKLG